jgi:hypothetical protein
MCAHVRSRNSRNTRSVKTVVRAAPSPSLSGSGRRLIEGEIVCEVYVPLPSRASGATIRERHATIARRARRNGLAARAWGVVVTRSRMPIVGPIVRSSSKCEDDGLKALPGVWPRRAADVWSLNKSRRLLSTKFAAGISVHTPARAPTSINEIRHRPLYRPDRLEPQARTESLRSTRVSGWPGFGASFDGIKWTDQTDAR